MDPSALMELAMENPQAEAGEGSPKDASWWSAAAAAGLGDMSQDLNSIHAANATCAAFHADVAAKHAASLAQWVQYLWTQIASLQNKIIELEDWKKKTLDDMSRLRSEHKLLRRKLMPDDQSEDVALPVKAKSLPLLLSSPTSSPGAMRPPPGLEMASDSKDSSKRVSFASSAEAAVAAALAALPVANSISPKGGEPFSAARSLSELSLAESASFGSETSPTSAAALDEGVLEGVHVTPSTVDGVECESAEWRIGHLSTKLKGCMGRALVSSPFTAWGLEDLRLMVFPDGKEVAKGPRSRRQKELYAKKVSEGPLEGCLKLKVPECPPPHTLEYYLKIGDVRKGPFNHNFAESTVNGCLDFGIDWLKQVDGDHSLTVSVQILRAGAAASGVKAPDDSATPTA
eukprot:CAMPEP_0171286972 /NCGR_PEP_ID=MMETSP0790-20130122/69303_1 /TAXON_ID=2925 /ORGANISM="Alexandrium catenella, Strain OF101" /LENGTH=401 /DNA_ID=CAMNT_0011756463 /DNA_START=100 /DNA_END=1305 /DNA_ORIENTATION=+